MKEMAMANKGPQSAAPIAATNSDKKISTELSPPAFYRIYEEKLRARAVDKHLESPLITHLDALSTFLKEQQMPEKEIEERLLSEAKFDVRKQTHYMLASENYAEREQIALQVIQILKMKLGDNIATKENVLATLNEWREEVKKSQKKAAGRLIEEPEKAVQAAQAPQSEAPNKQQISEAIKRINQKYLLAYLSHACKVPSAIAYEVNFFGINKDMPPQAAQAAGKLAHKAWDEIESEKKKRLEAITSTSFTDHLTQWMGLIPAPLSYEELKEKSEKRNFDINETKEQRKHGRSLVNGFDPVYELNKKVAVALDTARRFRKEAKVDITRQFLEHAESTRVEMQLKLGLLPISHTRQPTWWSKTKSMVVGADYQREFEPDRVRLEKGQEKMSFPERRAMLQKQLETYCPLRQAAQAVRLEERKVDPEKEKDLNELCTRLSSVKLA